MNDTLAPFWWDVEDAITDAHLIAWDTCHKIYLAMDQTEADWFRENYEAVVEDTPDRMLATLHEWWDASCGLRFISAVSHNEEDPNAGFRNLIPQFAGEDEDEDEDEDDDEDDYEEDEE